MISGGTKKKKSIWDIRNTLMYLQEPCVIKKVAKKEGGRYWEGPHLGFMWQSHKKQYIFAGTVKSDVNWESDR